MRALLLLLIAIATAPLSAAPTLTLRTHTERPPEMDAITIAEVGFGGSYYSLVLPRNWRLEPDLEVNALKFHSELDRAKMIVRFLPDSPAAVMQSGEAIRQFVAPHLTSAKLLEEFPTFSSAGSGKGVVFSPALDVRCRAAVLPTGRGCATFFITCRTNELSSERAFGALINSFRAVPAPANPK